MNEPAVAAAQAIDTGGAAGDGAARAGGGATTSMVPGRALPAVIGISWDR
ncbi:hypothetical protein [Mycobacteroides abscessus]|nr:hypothetical protein [Mycobacteroides abscessus]